MLTYIAELDDSSLSFHYIGSWSPLKGTTTNFQSTLHSTTQAGASAAVRFIATRAIVYATIPAGKGTSVRASVIIDGRTTHITRPSNSTTSVFGNVLFDSGTLTNTSHTLIVANAGTTTDSPLQLDRVHLQGVPILDVGPVTMTPPAVSSTASSTRSISSSLGGSNISGQSSLSSLSGSASISSPSLSPGATDSNGGLEVVSLPQDFKATATMTSVNGVQITNAATRTRYYSHLVTSTEADGTIVTEIVDSPMTQSTSSSARVSNGVIVGCVIGVLGLIALAIILLLLRLRIRRSTKGLMRLPDETTPELNVTPFDVRERNTLPGSSTARTTYHEAAGEFPRNEKAGSLYTVTSSPSRPAGREELSPTAVRNIPHLTFEGQDGSYVFVPHHRNTHSTSRSTIVSPEAASPIYSRAIRSSAIFLPGRSSDLPPSYQFNP